jgi:hypothetical protein
MRTCEICGHHIAPFGYGWPGHRKDIPDGRHGVLWVFAKHRKDAEARRKVAMGKDDAGTE